MTASGKKKRIIQTTGLHIGFWALFVLSEYLANRMHIQAEDAWLFIRNTCLALPVLMVPAYFMAFWAVPKWLQTKRFVLFGLSIVAVIVYVIYMRVEWQEFVFFLEENHRIQFPVTKLMKNAIRDYSVIALAVCLHIIGDWHRKQAENEKLIRAKAESDLRLLRSQLHPHFLFNSLNNIYSLALEKSDATANHILKLTDLLDYLLYWTNKEDVPLQKEIELIDHYFHLQKLRFDDNFKLAANVKISNPDVRIEPGLLLPLVENCFKHGGPDESGIFSIMYDVQCTEDLLRFQLRNSVSSDDKSDQVSGGLGLPIVRDRLKLLNASHKFDIQQTSETYEVILEIKLANGGV